MAEPEATGAVTETGPETATQTASQPESGTTASKDSSESFFDPTDLSPELMPAYKQMQAAFTKKTQAIAKDRKAIEEYRQIMADPHGALRRYAEAYGYQLTPAQQAAAAKAEASEWQPQTWDEVIARTKEETRKELLQQFAPVIDEVRNVKRTQIERTLDEADPEWRQYEDDMQSLLAEHPSLAKDPGKLLRLAIPSEVLETRAYQRALKKLQAKTDAAQTVSGGSSTARKSVQKSSGPMTFQEAFEAARRQVMGG